MGWEGMEIGEPRKGREKTRAARMGSKGVEKEKCQFGEEMRGKQTHANAYLTCGHSSSLYLHRIFYLPSCQHL